MVILIKRIISFLVLFLIGVVFYKKFIKNEGFFQNRKANRSNGENVEIEKMEKDPVCGTYIPVKTSLKLKSEGKTYYFCSEKCREEYISLLKK